MPRIDKTVFISYRRTNVYHALAVYQNLSTYGYDCFIDHRNVDSGSFERTLLENIASRAHFILVLTPTALERTSQPGDWLRREVEYAMEIKRNIVPLMFDGFDFGTSPLVPKLTGRLAFLKEYQAQRVPYDFFDEAMERVRTRFLARPVDAVLHPISVQTGVVAQQQQHVTRGQPTVTGEQLRAEERLERGIKLYRLERYSDALRAFSEAVRLRPDYAEAYNNRGVVYRKIRQYLEAIQDYTRAIELNEFYADAYHNRGVAYRRMERWKDAIRDFTDAIRIRPEYADAYNNRGNARLMIGDKNGAVADYRAALRVAPHHVVARENLRRLTGQD